MKRLGARETSSGFATGSVWELQMVCHARGEIFDGSLRNLTAEICCELNSMPDGEGYAIRRCQVGVTIEHDAILVVVPQNTALGMR